jgi:hypothetical protein
LNSKVLALIWDFFVFIFNHLIYYAKAGFSFEIKTSFRSSLYAGRNAIIAFPFRMGTVVLEYPM